MVLIWLICCYAATPLVIDEQIVGSDFLIEQHGLGFASVSECIQVDNTTAIHGANLTMQRLSQPIRIRFVMRRDFKKASFWYEDITKECVKQGQAVAGGQCDERGGLGNQNHRDSNAAKSSSSSSRVIALSRERVRRLCQFFQ